MSDTASETLIRKGAKIGRFVVEDQLGAGGMGLVFAAHDRQLDRRIALKVLRTLTSEDESHRMRLLREGQAMARITHENVITVHEVGIEGKLVFLAQELLDGGTLGQWLRTPRTQDEILEKFIAAGRGLAAAHAAGLVHRDFKPDNVLLGKDGRVRVADFGLARALEALEAETVNGRVEPYGHTHADIAQSPMAPLTRTGAVMGTPLYMAPEQHEGKPADERSDQFSFCVALYQALYGQPPFAGKTAVALADNVLAGRVLPPTKGSSVPARLRKLLLRGLSVPPGERFSSMEELLGELAKKPTRKLARFALLAAAFVGVGGGAVAGAYVVTSSSKSESTVPDLSGRRTLTIVGFKNVGGDAATAWISPALAELIGAQLATADVRVTSSDDTYRARFDLAVPNAETLKPELLAKLRARLGGDAIVMGSYRQTGAELTLSVTVEDLARNTQKRVEVKGPANDLPALAAKLVPPLREALGVKTPTKPEKPFVVLPRDPQAARAYVEGLDALRTFDYRTAQQRLGTAAVKEPDFAPAQLALANAYRGLLDREPANAAAKKAIAAAKALPTAQQLWITGNAQLVLDDVASAREQFRKLYAQHPDVLDYGLALVRTSEPDKQAATLAQLRELRPPAGDDPRIDEAEAAGLLAAGNAQRALDVARRGSEHARTRGASHTLAGTRKLEGDALLARGELAAAADANEEARKLFDAAGDRPRMIVVMQKLGDISLARGRLDDAFERYDGAAGLELQAGMETDAATAWALAAYVRAQQGRFDDADKRIADAAKHAGQSTVARAYLDLAEAHVAFGRGDDAAALERAKRCADATDVPALQPVCAQVRGEVLAEQGEVKGAREAYEQALELAEKIASTPRKQAIELALAQLELDEGKVTAAAELTSGVLGAAEAQGATALHAHASVLRARVKLAQDATNEAFTILAKLKPEDIPQFRVRMQYLATFGKTQVFAEGAESGGYDNIARARAEAEKAGWRGLVFEAWLARAEAEAATDAVVGTTDAKGLIHEARLAGFKRYVTLAEAIGRE
ncbi:MAG: serine/threonine-protein kinase [Kofleriaceae bacterium]|nr:serine/threonine-protein kinase [Kofleriaceae bacterium]